MRRIHADLLLVIAAVVWGVAFVFQKTAMDHIGPFLFIAVRSGVAVLALAPFAYHESRGIGRFPQPGLLPLASLAGAAFFTGAALQQIGLVTATATNAGFLTALYVIFTPILVWLAFGRTPMWIVWPAVALSFVGTWLLGGGTLSAFGSGDLLIAISAFFWAAHVVTVSHASRFARPITFTMIQFAIVGGLGIVGALLFEPISLAAIAAAWREIAYVGLLSSALTFTLLAIAVKYTPPTEAAVIVSSETLFAALAAYLMLGERLSLVAWCGAGLILGAVLLVQTAPLIVQRWQRPGADITH